MRRELGILLGAFAAGTLLAELFGAANLGIALSFGQMAVAIAGSLILVRAGRAKRVGAPEHTSSQGKPPPPPPRKRGGKAGTRR